MPLHYIYLIGEGQSDSARAKRRKSESSFRFLLSIIHSYSLSSSPGKSLASVPRTWAVRRRKQCLECDEEKKILESFPHVNFWLSSSSSSQVCCLQVLLLFPNSLVEYVICTIKPRLLPPRILFMCYVNWPFFLQGETEATDVTPCQNPISFLLGTNQNP